MKLPLLSSIENPGIILLLIVLFFGAIALITFLLRRFIPGLKEKKGEISEEVAVQEELDRILEPITDEEVLSKISTDEVHKDADELETKDEE